MEGKRKSNEHQERRGKQAFKRNISEREKDYPLFKDEFGHLARKSLNYQTPLEVFLNYIHDSRLSSLYWQFKNNLINLDFFILATIYFFLTLPYAYHLPQPSFIIIL